MRLSGGKLQTAIGENDHDEPYRCQAGLRQTVVSSSRVLHKEALTMCPHKPQCPDATAPDREAAHTIISHPEQGWSLLCNGVVVFDDTGELLPGGETIAPHRPTDVPAA
jgi:hypothetical protein